MIKNTKAYGVRYRAIMKKLGLIKKMQPNEKYLYPLMDSVPFQDLEVAIILCEMAFNDASNDNKGFPTHED